ncbi:MAG: hypothetical protein JRM80_05440 [Nitrososphaerota archaeon]|nr:hypothetical protein [Nitrososphaerota archaeon]
MRGTGDAKAEVLALAEIVERCKDRWVAIEVTERDRNSQPVKGRVVEEEVDRYTLGEKTGKYSDVCIFYAGELPYRLLL